MDAYENGDEVESIQAAIELSRRRTVVDVAVLGDSLVADAPCNLPKNLSLIKEISPEVRSLYEGVEGRALPIGFGRLLGELHLAMGLSRP